MAESLITGYTVYQYENAICSGSEDKAMVEGTTYMTSEFSPGSEVSFRVSATNSVGEGASSECVNGEIESESTVPGVPTSVTIQVQGTSIVVSWQEPANVRDPIIDYTVSQYETFSCGGTPNEFITTALSYTITGFTPGSQTSIQVSASNGFGLGPPSECMMVQIPSPSEQKSADVRSLNVTLSHGYELSDSGIPEPYIKVDWRFEETQSFIIGFYRESSCGILNQLVQKHSVASHTFTQGVAFDRSYSFQITAMGTAVRSECVSVFVPSPRCEGLNPQTRGRYPNCCGLSDADPACVGRAQDLNLPETSSLLGREKFFQRLVEKDKVDAPSSLLIRILGETLTPPSERQESWTPSQGDRALSAFCYHKPGNCGQDGQGNNLFSAEEAQAIGVRFTGFDFSSPTLQQELIQAYRNSPQTAIVSVPRALETVTPNDLEYGAFLLVPVDGPNQEALLEVLPSLDRDVFLPDGTTQSIPVMLFVTGYHDHRVVACGEAAPYCIVAPSQALLIDGESTLEIQDNGASAALATLYAAGQMWPMMTQDQLLALFISCLTYPERDPNIWGKGVPDLGCMSEPQGQDMKLQAEGAEIRVSGTPLANTAISVEELRYGRPFLIRGRSGLFSFSVLDIDLGTRLFQTKNALPIVQEPVTGIRILTKRDGTPLGVSVQWKDTFSLAAAYSTSPFYFGASAGTQDFDPGPIEEVILTTALRHSLDTSTLIAELTVIRAKAKSGLASLRGTGLGGAFQFQTYRNDASFSVGVAYSVIDTSYRLGGMKIAVPRHTHLRAKFRLDAKTFRFQVTASYTEPFQNMELQTRLGFRF